MAYSSWWDYWLREARRWLVAVSARHAPDGPPIQWSQREVYLLLSLREQVRTGALTGDTDRE